MKGSLNRVKKYFHCGTPANISIAVLALYSKAYDILEADGIIGSHPQSGYYVAYRLPSKSTLNKNASSPLAKHLNLNDIDPSRLVLTTLKAIRESGTIPLGSPFPDPHLFPLKQIRQYEKALSADDAEWGVLNDLPPRQ